MIRQVWKEVQGSVASLMFLRNGERITSGSGFLIGKRLITNNHVIQVPPATHIRLRFVGPDDNSSVAERTFTITEFRGRLLEGDPETSWDFAILDLDLPEFADIPGLTLGSSDALQIGGPIALLGFQFDQENLSVHAGVLASKFVQAGVKYLQLDASVNHGNSGGPLIDPEKQEVMGIVTRKATGLTRQFDQLIESFDRNVQALEGASSIMAIAGIDPIEVAKVTQRQFKSLALEIRRSANVGIGYAYANDKVAEALERWP